MHHFCKRHLPVETLFFTTEITQIVGTLLAVYGVFMPPIGLGFAAFVRGYALLAFLITDQLENSFLQVDGT